MRSFAAHRQGVSGAFGVYRSVPRSAEQTASLSKDKLRVPVLAIGGEASMGVAMGEMAKLVAEQVDARVLKAAATSSRRSSLTNWLQHSRR